MKIRTYLLTLVFLGLSGYARSQDIYVQYNPNFLTHHIGIDGRIFLLVLNTDQFRTGDLLTTKQPRIPLVQVISKSGFYTNTCYVVRLYSLNRMTYIPHRYLQIGTEWYRFIPVL